MYADISCMEMLVIFAFLLAAGVIFCFACMPISGRSDEEEEKAFEAWKQAESRRNIAGKKR